MNSIANNQRGVKTASARQDDESRVYTYTQEFTVIIRDVSTAPYMNHGEFIGYRKQFGQAWERYLVCIGCSEPFKDSDDFYICLGGAIGVGNPHMCRRCAEDYHRDRGVPLDEVCVTETAADGTVAYTWHEGVVSHDRRHAVPTHRLLRRTGGAR